MTNSQSEKGEKKSVAPVVAAGVGGLVVGLAIGVAVGTLGAGDEAPIKVKNGSLEIHLVHNNQKFHKNNNKWKINGGGGHGSDKFEVYFAPSLPAANCSDRKASGPEIVIKTNDQTSFTLKAPLDGGQNKTEINEDSGRVLTPEMDDRLLRYGAKGQGIYIESITVGGKECKLSGYDPDFSAIIVDE